MGRPRQHGEVTREALRSAAERLFERGGAAALSVRALAEEVGTTTRAVYSLFGSKEGLMVDALANRAFEVLGEGVDAHPESDDVVGDLVAMSTDVFRRFVREHPALFRVTFHRVVPELVAGPELRETRAAAFAKLRAKVQRLADAGLLVNRTVDEAVVEYQALCEGLATVELRGETLRLLPAGEEELAWRRAFETLLRGLTTVPPEATAG